MPCHSPIHLASGNVETDRAWVVVLEVVQSSAANVTKLIGDSLTGRAREGRDNSAGAGSHGIVTEVGLDAALASVGRALRRRGAELLEVDDAIAREGV